jgi:glycosyltransferase involved in cell wall biosynthesis
MSSYNHEKFIAESIESVLGQDFDDFELIIVDDASTDASRQIIQKYAAQDSRIRVILHETNCGISMTTNDGIEAAKGEFVAEIASDDVWMADKLTKQLKALESNPDLVIWAEGEIVNEKGQRLGKSFSESLGNISSAKKSGDIWQELLRSNYIFGSTLLYKKPNPQDARYDEGLLCLNDLKFLLELARLHQFHYIPEPLAKYRIHGDNAMGGSGPETLKRHRIAGKEYISIVEDAMQQHDDEITRETRAVIYGLMGSIYYSEGEKKKGLRFFLRAVKCNPLEKRNLLYPRLALKQMLAR